MSESGNGKLIGDSENKEPEKEQPDLVLTITMKKDGNIEVHGPGNGQLYNEPMCLFLLKKAERFIERHNLEVTKPKIVKPGGITNFVRGGFRK